MIQRFLSLVEHDPGALALIDAGTGTHITRADLLDRSTELASQLTTAGIVKGDAVAIQLPNSVDFVAAFIAALQLDLVVIPIDRDATETEVAMILGHFAVRGFIYRSGISVRSMEGRPNVPSVARLIKLTSGSSGRPKGIVTSEANLAADCTNIC